MPSIPAPDLERRDERRRMVDDQLRVPGRGIRDRRVLQALYDVPRHAFVPASLQPDAYHDGPLPIGHAQTISQPFVVAFMTEALQPRPSDRVLEIGTGSGYQAAVLSRLVQQVYSVEIVEPLASDAAARLDALGFRNVSVRHADGHQGWPDQSPFDAIIVTCAPETVPESLLDQLGPEGRMIVPVGPFEEGQELLLFRQTPRGLTRESVLPVRFVPMTGTPRS